MKELSPEDLRNARIFYFAKQHTGPAEKAEAARGFLYQDPIPPVLKIVLKSLWAFVSLAVLQHFKTMKQW